MQLIMIASSTDDRLTEDWKQTRQHTHFSFTLIFCFICICKFEQKKNQPSHLGFSFAYTSVFIPGSFLFLKLLESTPVALSVGCREPVDWAPIDGILPSLSGAQQMAGGLGSPDIHHCLAVRCSRSSALTSRTVPRTSLPPPLRRPISNDGVKWGAFSLGAFFFTLAHAALQMRVCSPLVVAGIEIIPAYKWLQSSLGGHYVMTRCAVSQFLASVSSANRNVIIAGALRSKNHNKYQRIKVTSIACLGVSEAHVHPHSHLCPQGHL